MAARDYTDGRGWAKLDLDSAIRLAEYAERFSNRTRGAYTKMLLVLYASMSGNGTVSVGYRTLAERAGTSEKQAWAFLKMLEDDGFLVTVGEKSQPSGKYTLRTWFWLVDEGAPKKGSTSATKAHRSTCENGNQKGAPCYHTNSSTCENDNQKGAYQINRVNQIGGRGSATASPPPDESEDYGSPGVSLEGFGIVV